MTARRTSAPFGDEIARFHRLDATGFAFQAPSCHGEGDWPTASGELHLHDATRDRRQRVTMLHESLFAACYAWLLPRGGLLLHAATLWLGGRAFVVAGPSTAGKSTLAERFAPNWWSDEHAFLQRDGDAWFVMRHAEFRANQGPFPWRVPLAGLLWLGPERTQSRLTPLTVGTALPRILPQALVAGPVTSGPVLDAVAQLSRLVPVAELSHCLATPLPQLAAIIAGVADAAA